MNVLVTGGAGFVGINLCKQLYQSGHNVTVVDIFKWGTAPIVDLIGKISFLEGDIRNTKLMSDLISKNDVVVNLAAVVGFPACANSPQEAQSVNVDAVREMCSALTKDQLFIQASTGSVYGRVQYVCTEESPTKPLSLYGETKLEAEKHVLEAGGVCPRFATAFGISDCMRFDLLPNDFTWKAVKYQYLVVYEPFAMRTLIDGWDIARAYPFIMEHRDVMKGQVFNVGDARLNVKKSFIVENLVSLTGCKVFEVGDLTDADCRDYEVSYDKIHALGFECTKFLEDVLPKVRDLAVLTDVNSSLWRIT